MNRAAAKKSPLVFLEGGIPNPPEMFQFFYMMIPENKKKRFIQAGNDIIKVIHGKVPGGKD
jgi:hypothetical protein